MKFKPFQIALAFFTFNLIIRLIYISYWDIALDEPFTIFYAQQNIVEIFKMLVNENNPPLHFFLLHFIIKLFGIGSFAMRLPSVVFSSIAAGVIFSVGNKFFNRNIGILSALLFSCSTMHIFFAHEARVYPLFVMLTAISLFYFLSIKSNQKIKNCLGLFIANVLLIYSHYFGWFVLITEFVCFVLFFENKKDYLINISLFAVAILICYSPIITIFYKRAMFSTQSGTWVAPPKFSELYGNINRFLNDRIVTAMLAVLFAIGIAIALKKGKGHTEQLFWNFFTKHTQIIFIFFAVPYSLMFALSFKAPMFVDRYILFTSIPLFIIIAIIIDALFGLSNKSFYASASVLLAAQLIFFNLKPDNNRRIKEVAETVKVLKKSANTKVYIAPHYANLSFAYYYNQGIFKDYQNFKQRLEAENIYSIGNAEILEETKDTITQKIIFVECGSEFTDPNKTILKYFESNYKLEYEKDIFEIYKVYSFIKQ